MRNHQEIVNKVKPLFVFYYGSHFVHSLKNSTTRWLSKTGHSQNKIRSKLAMRYLQSIKFCNYFTFHCTIHINSYKCFERKHMYLNNTWLFFVCRNVSLFLIYFGKTCYTTCLEPKHSF